MQYLRLEHVRIPRFNMLARFSSLSRDGDYSQPGPAKGACECSEVPLFGSLEPASKSAAANRWYDDDRPGRHRL